MNIMALTLASLAGGISMWLLAGLWHKVIMAQFYARETHASHEGTAIILLAYLILAALMTYIYSLGFHGGRPVMEGLRYGVVLGLLWVFPHELAMAGAHGTSIAYVFKNALWHIVEQGIGGIVIALAYARLSAG